MLSSQTTDEKLYAGIASLRAALGGTISVDAVLRTPKSDIFDSIQKLGMGNKKSQ
jgi:endonuclease III